MKLKKMELLFVLCILAVSSLFILYSKLSAKSGRAALLTYGEGREERIPLDKEAVYDFESNGYAIHISVKNQAAAFISSSCPDHICEHYGYLSKEGEIAVCLPAKATLSIVE
ncbi:MAG: NusG domain II-containing protein [Johnsonella sp.]|nr:NusG domain II-containing protein [Johnsonella sp.]